MNTPQKAYDILEREHESLKQRHAALHLMTMYAYSHPLHVWLRKYLYVIPMRFFPQLQQVQWMRRWLDINQKHLTKYEQSKEYKTAVQVSQERMKAAIEQKKKAEAEQSGGGMKPLPDEQPHGQS